MTDAPLQQRFQPPRQDSCNERLTVVVFTSVMDELFLFFPDLDKYLAISFQRPLTLQQPDSPFSPLLFLKLLFGNATLGTRRNCFTRTRRRVAQKLENPRILKITFHTLRHWKATMEYHKTKDILHVKQLLGHRSINSTMLYTQLISFERDDFTCRVVKREKEISELIEAGFEYVCELNKAKFFRKPK